jgi:hypothetical protein
MDDQYLSRAATQYRLHTCQYYQVIQLDLRPLLNKTSLRGGPSDMSPPNYTFAAQSALEAAYQDWKFFEICILTIEGPLKAAESINKVPLANNDIHEFTLAVQSYSRLILLGRTAATVGFSRIVQTNPGGFKSYPIRIAGDSTYLFQEVRSLHLSIHYLLFSLIISV